MNRSNRSLVTLQIGQISGGCSRAQRYPQTPQRHTGNRNDPAGETGIARIAVFSPRSARGGRRSGTGASNDLPIAIALVTYSAQ